MRPKTSKGIPTCANSFLQNALPVPRLSGLCWRPFRIVKHSVFGSSATNKMFFSVSPQDGPKMAPRWPQDGPKMAQDAPKSPRWTKMAQHSPLYPKTLIFLKFFTLLGPNLLGNETESVESNSGWMSSRCKVVVRFKCWS